MSKSIYTVGSYIATRLEQVGLKHYFALPGDYNLMLLDALLKNSKLQMISCCNELNAGYAADGYARAHGLAALVVTYAVGGLSALNAIAGAYAENIPIIVISGAPGTDAEILNQILHHTEGQVNYRYVRDIFSHVTAQAVIVNHLEDAPHLIDEAFMTAISTRKPVYLDIACNIVNLEISAPNPLQFKATHTSDPRSLNAAVDHAASLLNSATKPVLVGGVQLRSFHAIREFKELGQTAAYATAVMPDAKGFISEYVPNYIGVYWGPVSSPGCSEIVESSDAYLFAGAVFTDYTTTGYSALINPNKLIHATSDYVKLPGQIYNQVILPEFLSLLTQKIKPNDASLKAFNLIRERTIPDESRDIHQPLTTQTLFAHIQQLLTDHTAVIVETGDSWFNGSLLKLPEGCRYEIQMQYGSIGWSVGATLGYAVASQPERRVVALIGDGSFQIAAQEISTMIRYGLNPIIILINNAGYTIEAAIHDGPYNIIKNWRYSELVDVFNAEDGNGLGCCVSTEAQLSAALEKARNHRGLCLIEVIIDKSDCNKNLLEWGSRVSANNMKPPCCSKS